MKALKLVVVCLGLVSLVACGNEKKYDPDLDPGNNPELGALQPQSTDARRLRSTDWCMLEMRPNKKFYEGQQSYREDGIVVASSYEIDSNYNRIREVTLPQFGELKWRLDGDQLTHIRGEAQVTFTVSFAQKNNDRFMYLTYKGTSPALVEEFYECD